MNWLVFVAGAVLCWGTYGPFLHKGQVALGNPLRALLCVGLAYFLIAVLIPGIMLVSQGQFTNFNTSGVTTATLSGALGALGAICIIMAFKSGGSPSIVMPLVFGGAPLVNVLVAMAMHPPKEAPSPMLYLGYLLAAAGGFMVLYFKPSS